MSRLIAGFLLLLVVLPCQSAKGQSVTLLFSEFDGKSKQIVDHSVWDGLLQRYVVPGDDGLNRVDYAALKEKDYGTLQEYLSSLAKVRVRSLSQREQFAYWVNLYNAKTVDVILAHYPVQSIRDIDISPGFFTDGPWKKKLLVVEGVSLSLDDIEHEILRPIWRDPRIHYAVNCASVGCPNLAARAYTGERLGDMLDAAARDYVNSSRGVSVAGRTLTVSKIYAWYGADFGRTERDIVKHVVKYAAPALRSKLQGFEEVSHYKYDWSLNDVAR